MARKHILLKLCPRSIELRKKISWSSFYILELVRQIIGLCIDTVNPQVIYSFTKEIPSKFKAIIFQKASIFSKLYVVQYLKFKQK